MSSNYPPGGGFGVYDVGAVDQYCVNGHSWTAEMFDELGGRFYVRDDDSACPTCGADDILNNYPEALSDVEKIALAKRKAAKEGSK